MKKTHFTKQSVNSKSRMTGSKKNLTRSLARDGRMALINKDMKAIPIMRQCELLDLPRSSYYYEPEPETPQNLDLMRRIDELHMNHPYYGVLRMQAELTNEQTPINEKRIRRLMRKMGIEVLYRKPNLSKPCPAHLKYPYLLRGLDINRPNQVWSMDITYIPMEKGFMYLCAVIDWHSRFLLGWKLSNTLSVDFCIETLEEAVVAYGTPEIVNTDQGSQFTSDVFTGWVAENGIQLSMDGRGRATDNVMIERFWRSLKYEKIYLHGYASNLELFNRHNGIHAFL
ncbi:MAG: IS3 family transposase [Chitinophagaceae bacterium]